MNGLFSEICYAFNSIIRTQLWTNPSDNPHRCRHPIIVMQIHCYFKRNLNLKWDTENMQIPIQFQVQRLSRGPLGRWYNARGGERGRRIWGGVCGCMGCPSNRRFSIVHKYYRGLLLWFSARPGQWNIVNGLGALCYVPRCFSLQQCCEAQM